MITTWQDGMFVGGIAVLLALCVLQAGVWIGRWQESRRWSDAAYRRETLTVGDNASYVVHPADMMQYGRAMRFMQSDRPSTTRNPADALTAVKT